MQTESIPDALADALGRVVAKERETWRKERELAQAESRQTIAELRAQAAEFRLALQELHAADHKLVGERVASLQDGEQGPQGERGDDGKDGADGESGRDGVDGKDGAEGKPGRDGVGGKDGEPGIIGKDGRDGVDGKDGAEGKPGRDGIDGKDGEPGTIGKDGRDGVDGKDGSPGEKGTDGKPGEAGPEGPRGKFDAPKAYAEGAVHYESNLVFCEGATWCARRDTAQRPPHEDWAPVAMKGADAPVGEVHGVYDGKAKYHKFDLVAFNGAEWRAKKDDPGPLPGDGWRLASKQGERGNKGERGERGEPGKEGKQGAPAPQVVERKIEGFTLIDVMSDGSTVSCDMRSAFELYHGEAR